MSRTAHPPASTSHGRFALSFDQSKLLTSILHTKTLLTWTHEQHHTRQHWMTLVTAKITWTIKEAALKYDKHSSLPTSFQI